jgi:hypothetical protein
MAVPARPVSGVPIESAWGQVAHDTAVAQDIQAGKVAISVPAGGTRFDYTFTYPRPFASEPTFVAWALNGAVMLAVGVSLPTPTSSIIGLCRRDGATITATSVTVEWFAYGPRA